jgi:hypothetical protein
LFYPLKKKSLAWMTVASVVNDMNAIPLTVVTDGAKEENDVKWQSKMQHYRIKHKFSEPYSQWQNRAEGEIREIKRMIRKAIHKQRAPKRLWDYYGIWAAAIRRKTASTMPGLSASTLEESIHARMVDISAYAQFDWYSLVWYIDNPTDVASPRHKIGRWLGVAEDVGSGLTYHILPKSCIPIA